MKIRNAFCAALTALFVTGLLFSSPGFAQLVEEDPAAGCCAAVTDTGFQVLGSAAAEAETLSAAPSLSWFESKGLSLGESRVVYPALREGTMKESLRTEINDRILADGRAREYVTRVSQLISGGKLEVDWQGQVLGVVFSFAFSAEGAVDSPRNTWVWTGGNIDLRDGHEVTLAELFTDPQGGREEMERYLEEEIAPELSPHLGNSQLTPLPELFRITERGILWMYPISQLSTLSDRAGSLLIPWQVVRPHLNLEEGSLLEAMNLSKWILPISENEQGEEALAEDLRKMTEAGEIPGIPARLGDRLQPLTETWRMLTDPDVYALGRYFALEGAEFQGVFLMTDFLSESWENSVVDGIRVDLGSVYGLSVGETPRQAWLEALGEPDHTLDMDGDQAEAYRLEPGTRDYYEFGDHRLQLCADEEGILTSVMITE